MVQMFNTLRKMVDAVTLLAVIVVFIMVSNTPVGRKSVPELNVPYTMVLPKWFEMVMDDIAIVVWVRASDGASDPLADVRNT
jgi:hypothetical protein